MSYNGYTNYATWRIQLEVLDGFLFEGEQTAESIKYFVHEIIFQDNINTLANDYARAFLAQVNYYELAEHANNKFNN